MESSHSQPRRPPSPTKKHPSYRITTSIVDPPMFHMRIEEPISLGTQKNVHRKSTSDPRHEREITERMRESDNESRNFRENKHRGMSSHRMESDETQRSHIARNAKYRSTLRENHREKSADRVSDNNYCHH